MATVVVTERIDLPDPGEAMDATRRSFILPGYVDGSWLRARLGDADYDRGVRTGAIVEVV